MRIKNLLFLLFLAVNTIGKSQDVRQGNVLVVIPIGNQGYSIINEIGTENYYKSSPHEISELNQGQSVGLQFNTGNNNSGNIEVIAPLLTTPLFCQIIQPNNSGYTSLLPLLRGIELGYRNHVNFNATYNVLQFSTWEDVMTVESMLYNDAINYPYNQGNEETIFDIMNLIREHGWNMAQTSNGNKVSLVEFKEYLNNSHPLSSGVLNELIDLEEDEELNSNFMYDVFTSNLPLSYNTEQKLTQSSIPNGILDQILDANDNHLDAPNYAFRDFLALFPQYNSLYEKLNLEELDNLKAGMDPLDPRFDNDIVFLPFERLIMNDKHEVWIEGRLYKLYDNCKAIAMQANVVEAYQGISSLNDDGSPNIPTLDEDIAGLPIEIMDGFIPQGYIIYNPEEFDPLGSVNDDPFYNTALQDYNIVNGCPKSNFTYSLYTIDDLTVDFIDQTSFTSVIQPENTFIQYWYFGDGTGSFQENPAHKFPDFGTYTVTLTTFNADCGCWHVHKTEVVVLEPQFREGNPDCPIDGVTPFVTGNGLDELEVKVVVNPGNPIVTGSVVANYTFEFQATTGSSTITTIDNGSSNTLEYTLPSEGEYLVVVQLTWSNGCFAFSNPHPFTVYSDPPTPDCCDKKVRVKNPPDSQTTFNDDQYKLKIKDIARGTFGTAGWRKIQGTQKLYVKKSGKLFWKKQPAWHEIWVNGTYYDRFIIAGASECIDGHIYSKYGRNCNDENYEVSSPNSAFFNKFGLDEKSISITHTVYLGGAIVAIPPVPGNCCDCNNSGGHLLFDNILVELGECP